MALRRLPRCMHARPVSPGRRRGRTLADRCRCAFALLVATLLAALAMPEDVEAAIVYIGASSGRNDALPTNGSAGALTIARPAGIAPGQALVASIAARPRSMTVTAPTGWVQMTYTNQTNGGSSTAPGGMSLITYYKIVTTSEPANYTWTFANPSNSGGSAVGGILAFSGIDTANGNPIDNNGSAWSARLTGAGTTHGTNSINTVSANTMIVSSISYLSASNFNTPTGITGVVERLDQSAPLAANAVGTTLQMSTAPRSATGATGSTQAVAAGEADNGIGHLMALQPSRIDPALAMTRGGALSPGGSGSYTLTVTNLGIDSEPGPLTIVDTLPAGLSFASASGSGWTCSAAAQVVTCTRIGAIAASASAPSLTIQVNVGVGTSGALTNSATVSGTGGDSNPNNNTATDSYVIPTAPYAYYALDEPSWGSVVDASGNSRHATKLGSAAPTGTVVPSPPGAAIAGTPGTCGAATIPSTSGTHGINTGIDINSLGNAGTIAFWYTSNAAWNTGSSRMLLDASNDLPAGDRHFFLAKDGNGALVFSLKDSAGTTSTASTISYGYPAGEWHHIAVSWNTGTPALAIYLDGVLAGSSSTALNGSLGDMATLYVGAQRMAGLSGAPGAFSANSANGLIDEVRLYASALSALEIDSLVDKVHTCSSGIDHYELSLPSTAISCLPVTVTISACTNASSPCTSRATTLAGQTVTLGTSGGSLAATTVTFDATGIATTTLSHASAANGTVDVVSLSGEQSLAANPRQCCANGTTCTAANSCAVTFGTAGFIIAAASGGAATTVPTQTAGTTSASYLLRAVATGTTTKACEPALTGATSVNWTYQCHNPSTCSAGNRMTLTGSSAMAINGSPASGVTTTTAVPMTFNANGEAPFTFNVADVGQIMLWASKPAGGSLSSSLSGNSNAFVVRPAGFAMSAIRCSTYAAGACAIGAIASPGNNPGATTPAGTAFMPAGAAFSATVTAVDAAGNATPNYGRETTPQGVTLAATLVQPAGGNAPALVNASAFGAFSGGSASGSTFAWPEVGIITLRASAAGGDYLGTGNVTGAASGAVGRFVPHHFDIAVTPACGAFSYAGQPFNATITARNGLAVPGTTLNYDGAAAAPTFAKAVNLSDAAGFAGGGFTSGASVAAAAFVSGVASAVPGYGFTQKTTAPRVLALRAIDADGVSSSGYVEGGTLLRSGRLRLGNGTGSEKSALSLPVRAEYWSGSSWLLNSDDSCTSLPAGAVALSNRRTHQGNPTSAWSNSASAIMLAAGLGTLTLGAPSPAASGSVDVALNLGSSTADQSCLAAHPATTGAARAWLRSLNGSCAATADRDPSARAAFGIYSPETQKTIHARELY